MVASTGSGVEKSAVLKLFPTYVWATQFEASVFAPVNARIRQCLSAIEDAHPNLAASGQWQSDQMLHQRPELAGLVGLVRQVTASIFESLTLVHDGFQVTGCWANVSDPGYPHRPHAHPNNYLSGVWYVQTAPGADSISFFDPRPQASMMAPPARRRDIANQDTVSLDVAEGMLVMFPSWLLHAVDVNQSSTRRISIAFNVMFPSFGTVMARPTWQADTPSG